MSNADLCRCEHKRNEHDNRCWHGWQHGVPPCPCTAFTVRISNDSDPFTTAQPATEPEPPASEIPDLAAGIEGVLGEHVRWSGGMCLCGWLGPKSNTMEVSQEAKDAHRAHVAAAIVAYLHRKKQG